MGTSEGVIVDGEALVHISTGRLTHQQGRIVAGWRTALRTPDSARWGLAEYPPASSSSCLAAAVCELMEDARPTPHALMAYATTSRDQIKDERGRGIGGAAVSVYIPTSVAEDISELTTQSQTECADHLDEIRAQVNEELPGRSNATARATRFLAMTAREGLPIRTYRIPTAVIARMAIDRWTEKPIPAVIGAGIEYAKTYNRQPHRARRDTGTEPPSR